MSFGSPAPPPPPDPYRVAQVQQQVSISTGIANAYLQNANIVSPQGTSTFTQTGTYTLSDPQYDAAGALAGTTDRDIPIFTQTITLTTKGQDIFDKYQDMQLSLNTLGDSQLSYLQSALGVPFSLSSLPSSAQGPNAPSLSGTISQPNTVQYAVGDADTSADRASVIAGFLARPTIQFNTDRSARIATLATMGIFPGTEAYENEMRIFDFRYTDMQMQAETAGGQEQTRQFQIALAQGNFHNQALDLDFREKMLIVDFSNRTSLQRFQALTAVADFINTFRERRLQELLTERNQPLNELSTMLHGGQLQIPSYTGFKSTAISDTPLGQYVYQSANLAEQNYQAKLRQQEAMIGGIAQLGGAILKAPMTDGASVAGALVSKMPGMS